MWVINITRIVFLSYLFLSLVLIYRFNLKGVGSWGNGRPDKGHPRSIHVISCLVNNCDQPRGKGTPGYGDSIF